MGFGGRPGVRHQERGGESGAVSSRDRGVGGGGGGQCDDSSGRPRDGFEREAGGDVQRERGVQVRMTHAAGLVG